LWWFHGTFAVNGANSERSRTLELLF
jgi:hypothetical protein